jgi:hypothetical protein
MELDNSACVDYNTGACCNYLQASACIDISERIGRCGVAFPSLKINDIYFWE